ncbi:hypothetical protein GCM10009108_13100 [Castellaniella ginsengisoli]|uniref:Uncharacterized protein n=1 Tax=Castellaniella ginsengisoli TaxID=546114 RepID=A0ABN1KW66_9BURK
MHRLDVAVVGAGAAGIGMALALALQKVPGLKFGVLEAGRVGESFRRWPAQTRFITLSFHSNPFGLSDLNAVNEPSSPAIHSGAEHLSGPQYADYLTFVAKGHELACHSRPIAGKGSTTQWIPDGWRSCSAWM